MINKKNLWFLTLFSLVLVLSIYYVTMPNDLLQASNTNTISNETTKANADIEESNIIAALKVEDDTETSETISSLQETITSSKTTTEEKNKAYESLKTLNNNNALEDSIEEKIKSEYKCNAFAKIEESKVRIVVDGCEKSTTLANNIMRLVQSNFENKMYISVQFES